MDAFIGQALIPVQSIVPATDAAGRTGSYVSLKNCVGAYVVFHIDQGNAATIALSLSGATDAAGTGATALTGIYPIFTVLDCATTAIPVAQTAASNYTTDAGVKRKYVIFRVDPAAVTAQGANTLTYIAAVTGASNAANLTEASIWLLGEDQPFKVNPAA